MHTVAASWNGCVRVVLWEEDGKDHFRVTQDTWHGAGCREEIARGVLGESA